jgi:hypothetical protein
MGTAVCKSGQCDFQCQSGRACGKACIPDSQPCNGACGSGRKPCGTSCIASAACCTAGHEGCLSCQTCTNATCANKTFTNEVTAGADALLKGTPLYFNGGNPVPPGMYSVSYTDGCMVYGGGQGWTINAFDQTGCCNWWLVGETTADLKLLLPGTTGIMSGAGAFDQFPDCVQASKLVPPRMFNQTAAGKLGVWLRDIFYDDNVGGEGGRNPRWSLSGTLTCTQ